MKVLVMPPSDTQGAQFISCAILKPYFVMLYSLTLELAIKVFPNGRTSIVHLYQPFMGRETNTKSKEATGIFMNERVGGSIITHC